MAHMSSESTAATAAYEVSGAGRGQTFHLLACLLCEPPLPVPFSSAAERGKWAAAHRDGAGHDTWRVWDETTDYASHTPKETERG